MSGEEQKEFVCLEVTTVPYEALAETAYAGLAMSLRSDMTGEKDIIVIAEDEVVLRHVWSACGMTFEPDPNKFGRVIVAQDRRKK